MKLKFTKSLSNFLIIGIFLISYSCVQAPSNKRSSLLKSNSAANSTETTLPTFKEGNNTIQNGSTIYSSTVNLDLNFKDTLVLRGKEVDNYIRNNGLQTILCLTARFETVTQINILAAMPRSFYNFSTKALEYYYSFAPDDEAANKSFCQKAGLISHFFTFYPAYTLKYKWGSLCPSSTCLYSTYTSKALQLYADSGLAITAIGTTQLSYVITNRPATTSPIGKTCTQNSDCQASGYDCCSFGNCVKDLALKPGVDTASANYVQALQDILSNPNHIYLYPQYYFLCSSMVNNPSNPSSTTPPTTVALNRLKNLTNLYNCINKVEGEMGYCTKTISNAIIGTTYNAGIDDRSFSGTYTNQSSGGYTPSSILDLVAIQEISLGDVVLFNYDQVSDETFLRVNPYIVSSYVTINGQNNDNHSAGTSVVITAKPASSISDDLVIKYKNDASCEKINSTLAKCEKHYVQGQQKSGDTLILNRRGRVTDHYPGSSVFLLPYYADTSKNITVSVDGITQKQGSDWELNNSAPVSVDFYTTTSGLRVLDGQKVKIRFFVNLSVYSVMDSKISALTEIKSICHCAELNCGLSPIKNSLGAITDYACIYPDPNPSPAPDSQKVYLSSKAVPVRFFDSAGVSQPAVTGDTLPQEGTAFLYRKGNLLNPNNMPDIISPVVGENVDIGFNEIYGSLSYVSNSAKPAKELTVTKGKTYDIFVDNGAYSNCLLCGNDYYSQLNKLFPLTQFGGGLVPMQSRTSRSLSNGIRGDDFSFGRACFVPATMIPFSHAIYTEGKDQRLSRMQAQHFLYANGYQRDWYGFDYGAVIGSFDGVKWFAIGTNRRIKAETNKLFLAINGPFGDLAVESSYAVTVNDGALNPASSNMVTSDFESDGAQCQKFHQCTNDNECATTLGWDYICADVNQSTTSWPRFDDNAKEIPDTLRDDDNNHFTSILKVSISSKRCVYRGRGAACTQNYNNINPTSNTTFNSTEDQSQHVCSANNYCQPFKTGASFNYFFNNRIARYGKVRTDATSDSFGFGAKIPGRPMEFNAIEPAPSAVLTNFNSNKLLAICVPGRDPEEDTFLLQNKTAPPGEYLGDRVVGIGMTYKKSTLLANPNYLNACSVMNSSGNYYYAKEDPTTSNLLNTDLQNDAGKEVISSNALYLFNTIFNNLNMSLGMYQNNSTTINAFSLTENRCLRAPGASCFSDIDCAPSKPIADKIKTINPEDAAVSASINKYEVKFWQEELVCSQSTAKTDPAYSAFNNRCCREVGKKISLPSADTDYPLEMDKVPGIDINISSKYRYSRVATVYKDQKDDATTYPLLQAAVKDQCATTCMNTSLLTNQFNTFALYAERNSCSGDWIRNFDNGNHVWDKSRFQTFKPGMFRCMNWLPAEVGLTTDQYYSCKDMEEDDPKCLMVQTLPNTTKAVEIMSFLGRLELMGIPQIALESEDFYNDTSEGYLSCRSSPTDQAGCYPTNVNVAAGVDCNAPATANYASPTGLFTAAAVREYTDGTYDLYSAKDEGNFLNMKKVFKADEVVSCLPAGTNMDPGADASLCCTGFINSKNNKCQLPDYVDVSIYTNRYVSSEGKKLNSNLFDQYGYIMAPSKVAQLACEKSMCASGKLAYGVLISSLKTPGLKSSATFYRFLESNSSIDDLNGILTQYNKGLKLNTHAYCFPENSSGTDGFVTVITCGN